VAVEMFVSELKKPRYFYKMFLRFSFLKFVRLLRFLKVFLYKHQTQIYDPERISYAVHSLCHIAFN